MFRLPLIFTLHSTMIIITIRVHYIQNVYTYKPVLSVVRDTWIFVAKGTRAWHRNHALAMVAESCFLQNLNEIVINAFILRTQNDTPIK